MFREHKLEVETVTRKLTGDGMDIEELKRRSKQLDHSQQEVKDLKKQLREQNDLLRRTTVDLDDTVRVIFCIEFARDYSHNLNGTLIHLSEDAARYPNWCITSAVFFMPQF